MCAFSAWYVTPVTHAHTNDERCYSNSTPYVGVSLCCMQGLAAVVLTATHNSFLLGSVLTLLAGSVCLCGQ